MAKIIEILHLEDNPIDAAMVRNYLSVRKITESYTLVTNEKGFKSYFDNQIPSVILTDINIPGYSGLDALDWIRTEYPLIPIIVVTGSIDEETAAKTIQRGAWDYVVKERLHRLPSAIDTCINLQKVKKESFRAKKLAYYILKTTPSAVFTVDTTGRITSWNKMAESITGYKAAAIIGKNCRVLKSSYCTDVCSLFDSTRKGDLIINQECDIICANGDRKYIIKNADVLKNSDGEIVGGIESFLDQTDKIRMTQELIASKEKAEESDRLKSAFLANISHEIRTPLNAIIGFTDLIIEPDLDPEEKEKFIKIIRSGSDQLLTILNNVLQIALIESGKIELNIQECDADELLSELNMIWRNSANKNHLNLTYASKEQYFLKTDKRRLLIVLNNLIENAIKFTSVGNIKFGYRNFGTKILFYVSDSGKGIPDSIGEKVYDRFFRISDSSNVTRGSGLGLSISRAIVEALNGKIWHEPNPVNGTTFYVELPKELRI